MSEFKFEEPPPKARKPRFEAAQQLRENPGRWARVGSFSKRTNANSLASIIRRGASSVWAEPGDFDAVARATDGEFRVYARFLGDGGQDDE